MPMQKDEHPAVSVAMGVRYQRESIEPLKRSIESVLNQTYRDFQLLICDDGSTSAAMRFLDETCQRDDRIRLVRPGGKLDLASKLNVCLREARGRYIARMDDDDYSHPDRFEKQICVLETERDIGFVGCCVNLAREGAIVGARKLSEYPEVRDFYFTAPFVHPALMFRREALERVGGYCEEAYCNLCEDYDLLLRLYAHDFKGKNLQERLLDYTLPPAGRKNRTLRDRWHEAQTRSRRFRELGVMHEAWPYVVKPIAVALLPQQVIEWFRRLQNSFGWTNGC